MSVPFCSVQTIKVSDRVIQSVNLSSFLVVQACGVGGSGTLLFLIAIVLGDASLEQDAIGLILRFDEYSRFFL